MAKRKAFYDTNAFLFYSLKRGDQKNHPSNIKEEPCISVEVLQETIHINARGNNKDERAYSEYNNVSSFMELWELFDLMKGMFKVISPNSEKVRNCFNTIVNRFVGEFGSNFEGEYGNSLIETMDMLLLAVADVNNCRRFITADKSFEIFEKIGFGDIIDVKKITILDMDNECKELKDFMIKKL